MDTYPDFRIDPDRVAAAVTPRTKIILLNSPANPTGAVAGEEEVRGLAELAARRNVVLLSDEIYRDFCYDRPFVSPATFNPRTLVVDGFSKTYGMPGWRLGFAHGPAAVIREMVKLQQYSFVCAPQPAQWAGLAAMDVDMGQQIAAYRRKRDMVVAGLAGDYVLAPPGGAFYAFPQLPWGSGSGVFISRGTGASTVDHTGQRFQRPRHAFPPFLCGVRRDAGPRHRGPAKPRAGALRANDAATLPRPSFSPASGWCGWPWSGRAGGSSSPTTSTRKRRKCTAATGLATTICSWATSTRLRPTTCPTACWPPRRSPATTFPWPAAGKGLRGKHSSAFWGLVRVLGEMGDRRPRLLMIENVVGFLISRGGRDLEAAMLALNELGYALDALLLNAAHWTPQSRPRLFVLGNRDECEEPRSYALACDARPEALLAFINGHVNIRWNLRNVPPLPRRPGRLTDILEDLPEDDPHWWNEERTEYLMQQMSPRQCGAGREMIAGESISYATAFRRVRRGRAWRNSARTGLRGVCGRRGAAAGDKFCSRGQGKPPRPAADRPRSGPPPGRARRLRHRRAAEPGAVRLRRRRLRAGRRVGRAPLARPGRRGVEVNGQCSVPSPSGGGLG